MTGPTRRQRAPRGAGEQLREQLIVAAEELFTATGRLETLTVREVASRVGVSTPSIYLHFPDKDALLDAVIARVVAQLGQRLDRAASTATSPRAALGQRCQAYLQFAIENPDVYRAAMMAARPNTDALLDATVLQPLIALFAELALNADPGVTRDPVTDAVQLWASVHGIASMTIAKPLITCGDTLHFVERTIAASCDHRALVASQLASGPAP